MMPIETKSILSTKLLLTEGKDAKMFLVHMLQLTGINTTDIPLIQVFDYGGIKNLTGFIKT